MGSSLSITAPLLFLLTHTHTIIMMTINAISRSPPPDGPAITPIKASLDRSDGDSVVAEGREEI